MEKKCSSVNLIRMAEGVGEIMDFFSFLRVFQACFSANIFKQAALKIQIGRNNPLAMVVLLRNSNNRFLDCSNCR